MEKTNISKIHGYLNKYQVITKSLVDHEHATIKLISLLPGQTIPKHQVPLDVTFIILKGQGKITIGTQTEPVTANDVILCPPDTVMSLEASRNEGFEFLNIKTPGVKSVS